MPKPVRVDLEAEEEIAAGIDWYERKRPGLSAEFKDQILRKHIVDCRSDWTGDRPFGASRALSREYGSKVTRPRAACRHLAGWRASDRRGGSHAETPGTRPYSIRRRWTLADAKAALSALAASGLSVSAFASHEGLDEERLYRWRRRLAAESKSHSEAAAPAPTPDLIEIRPIPRRPEVVEIVLSSGVTVRVRESIDPSTLAGLVAALRRC